MTPNNNLTRKYKLLVMLCGCEENIRNLLETLLLLSGRVLLCHGPLFANDKREKIFENLIPTTALFLWSNECIPVKTKQCMSIFFYFCNIANNDHRRMSHVKCDCSWEWHDQLYCCEMRLGGWLTCFRWWSLHLTWGCSVFLCPHFFKYLHEILKGYERKKSQVWWIMDTIFFSWEKKPLDFTLGSPSLCSFLGRREGVTHKTEIF